MNRFLTATAFLIPVLSAVACARLEGSPNGALPGTVLQTFSVGGNDAASARAVGSGRLVDERDGKPLAGIRVGLAPWVPKASPVPQGVTDRNGRFRVSGTPGKYLLYVGSDQGQGGPSAIYDAEGHPTIHEPVTLTSGVHPLIAPSMPPVKGQPEKPTQTGGLYRLSVLAPQEKRCVAYYNQVRQAHHQSAVVVDEWLTENNRTLWHYDNRVGILSPGAIAYNGADGGQRDCKQMIQQGLYGLKSWKNSLIVWFAGDAGYGKNGATQVEGMVDIRGTLPPPRPPNPWP